MSKTKIFNFILILTLMVGFSVPLVSSAEWTAKKGFINCGTELNPIKEKPDGTRVGGDVKNPCNSLAQLLEMVDSVINFVLFKLVVPLSAIMFAYAGILLLISGGNESKKTKAKKIFTDVIIGIVVALAAWLIIGTILSIVQFKGNGGTNYLGQVEIFN